MPDLPNAPGDPVVSLDNESNQSSTTTDPLPSRQGSGPAVGGPPPSSIPQAARSCERATAVAHVHAGPSAGGASSGAPVGVHTYWTEHLCTFDMELCRGHGKMY